MLFEATKDTTGNAFSEGRAFSDEQRIRLSNLFPGLSDSDLGDVAETFYGYCAIVWSIYERLKRERPEVIDELMRSRTMKGKVDSRQQKIQTS